jgi:light-regulated signal transduction histidine kinase (bacteriophytochrome)
MLLSIEEEKYRRQSEELTEINAELENINWISGHDLQEPLRKIQMLVSKVMSQYEKDFSDDLKHSLTRIQHSADTMQNLLIDILRFIEVKHAERVMEEITLDSVVANVITDFHDVIMEHDVVVQIGDLPQVTGIQFLVKQLFSNLISNCIKFRSPGRSLIIKIEADGPRLYHPNMIVPSYRVSVSDNGIGFEQKYAKYIFDIFRKLHYGEFGGSGMGLAICKKIMQRLSGEIEAEGNLDGGTTINLYFPEREIRPART